MHTLMLIGCPTIVRVDKGTENVGLATVHIGLRMNHEDEFAGEKCFIYGPSKHNIVSTAKSEMFILCCIL